MKFDMTRHCRERMADHWPDPAHRKIVLDEFARTFKRVRKHDVHPKKSVDGHEMAYGMCPEPIGMVRFIFDLRERTLVTVFPLHSVSIKTGGGKRRNGYGIKPLTDAIKLPRK